MGISTAGHFPAITSTSYPTLTSHIVSAYNAQRIGQWSVSLRLFRSVVAGAADGAKRSKLMYVVQMSEFPDDTFVLIEDTQCETRASIRARHTFAVMQQAAAEAEARQLREQREQQQQQQQQQQLQQQQQQQKDESQQEDQDEDLFGDSSMADAAEGEAEPTAEDGTKLDGDKVSSDKEIKKDADVKAEDGKTEQNGLDPQPSTTDIGLDGQALPQPQPDDTQADPSLAPEAASSVVSFLPDADKPTRWTLFVTSLHYTLMLTRLNLPAPLGAPSMGDGGSSAPTTAGPGAWLPRGQPITIQGAVYDVPSATGFGSGGAEWRVRLGMIQSRGASTQNVGAIVEAEYLPLLRLASDAFLSSYLQNLFPAVITQPGMQANGATTAPHGAPSSQVGNGGIANPVPTPEQWQEVIPASNQAWMDGAGISPLPESSSSGEVHAESTTALPLQQKDPIGWRGKERGRRLAYLYITLLRNQSVI